MIQVNQAVMGCSRNSEKININILLNEVSAVSAMRNLAVNLEVRVNLQG